MPFDRHLLTTRDRLAVGAVVAVGLVATASVVVQAVALARLLASAMPGARPVDVPRSLALLGGAFAVRGLCAFASELLGHAAASHVKLALRRRLVRSSLQIGPGTGRGPGELATLAGRGLDALDVYLGRCLPDLVLAAAAPVVLAAAVGVLDWVSGLIVLAALGLFPLFGVLVGKASLRLAADRWRQLEHLGWQVADVFAGLPVLKAYGLAPHQRRRIAEAGKALGEATMATLRTAFLSALVLDTLASVSVALVAVPLGLRLLSGSIHLSAALAVLIVAPEVFAPLRRATAEFHQSTEGMAALARVGDVAPTPAPDGTVGANEGNGANGTACTTAVPAPRDPCELFLRHVRVVAPGRAAPLLDDVSLDVGAGETVVLVGANGAGKSTLLSVVLGLVRPDGGTVSVGGHDLAALDQVTWRRHVAYLPERPALLAATLADNLRLAAPGATDGELEAALAAAGLDGRMALQAPVGEGGRPVSAGERQRIGLARALLRGAATFLLDEPTAHLDADGERAVVETLRRVLADRTALVVTHRPAVLSLADRVVTVGDGRLVATG